MKRTAIKKVIVYYAYWANKELFGVHAADENCMDIIVQYDSGRTRKFFFGGYKGIHLPLAAAPETVPKSVQEFMRTAKEKSFKAWYNSTGEQATPFDQFTFE